MFCASSEGGRNQNKEERMCGGGVSRMKSKDEWRLDRQTRGSLAGHWCNTGKLEFSQQNRPPGFLLAECSLSEMTWSLSEF